MPGLRSFIRRAAAPAALALLLSSCGGSTHHAPLTLPAVSGGGPESIFEEEALLHADPAGTLDRLRQLGVNRVRVYISWAALAPDPTSRTPPPGFDGTDPAAYPAASWAIYDTIVRDTLARGLGLDVLLSSPAPEWATSPGEPPKGPVGVWRPSARDYGEFVQAVATRYNGSYVPPGDTKPLPRVDFWSIWNEPNIGVMLAPQAVDKSTIEVSPASYRRLLDAAWSALKAAGHEHDTILIGELAPAGESLPPFPGNFAAMVPLRFLRALYCVDASYRPLTGVAAAQRSCPTTAAGSALFPRQHPALFDASGFAVHPYPQGLPPNEPTPGEPDYAELADMPKFESTLDALQRVYGSSKRYAIWSTEFGYQTKPPDPEPLTTTPQLAAYYLNWAEYLTWRDPRIKSYDQYLLQDPSSGIFASGLLFPNGQPKPAFYAYRMPIYLPVTSAPAKQALEVWGCVRPFDYARLETRTRQRVQIQFQSNSRGPFATVTAVSLTNRHGYFDVAQRFPGSGTVRLAWTYPHGSTIYSRLVNITLQ
ncbi:MAG: hypothetical protein ABSG43_05580 [Solirubrobacteraceae bacterium]